MSIDGHSFPKHSHGNWNYLSSLLLPDSDKNQSIVAMGHYPV